VAARSSASSPPSSCASAIWSCRARVDADHEKQLTRDEITASVHYIHFRLDADQVAAFTGAERREPVELAFTHPAYQRGRAVGRGRRRARRDLRDGG
jgi:hypothetical protein